MYLGPAVSDRHTCGTTISVRDLFYRWPVRQKQASASSSSRQAVLTEIRRGIEQLAIINPGTAFSIMDMERPDADSALLTLPATGSSQSIFGMVFGQHLVAKADSVNYNHGQTRVSGFFSLTSAHTKTSQLIAVNGRPIHQCDLHRHINKLFSRSSFAKFSDLAVKTYDTEVNVRPLGRNSPRRHMENHPVFFLHIEMPNDKVDIGLEPSKRLVHFVVSPVRGMQQSLSEELYRTRRHCSARSRKS